MVTVESSLRRNKDLLRLCSEQMQHFLGGIEADMNGCNQHKGMEVKFVRHGRTSLFAQGSIFHSFDVLYKRDNLGISQWYSELL